ncbi:hypothetical protein Droror1_Dr00023460 [Drosera rotundifolia]
MDEFRGLGIKIVEGYELVCSIWSSIKKLRQAKEMTGLRLELSTLGSRRELDQRFREEQLRGETVGKWPLKLSMEKLGIRNEAKSCSVWFWVSDV